VNITAMCKQYIAEQRELLKLNDPAALAPRTLKDYIEALERHIMPEFGWMKPKAFQPMHAAQYLHRARKDGRAVRANREIAALASAFNHGMALGLVPNNPCRGVRRNKERPRDRSVSIAEVNALLALAEERGGAALMVALIAVTVALTGRRRGDILALQQSALTADGIEVEDGKVRRHGLRRYLVKWSPLLRRVVELAAATRPAGDYVFPTRTGSPYTDSGFKTEWNKLIRLYEVKTGERFRAHDLRALYVSEMLGRGQDPNTHQNQTTMRRVYDRRRVIEVEPLA
jgi:integrase